jgi:2,4-dienoyl-CoA reductase-like NADH-dependent reductase (Old Yellow Enzyme family)
MKHETTPLLFSPWSVRGVQARNRIVVSPMCMYASPDGTAQDYHLVHLGRFALGGAGVVIVEATAIEPRGRISSGDLGLWSDAQGQSLHRIVRFLKEYGAVPGIQLAHAGRKASTQPPWRGGMPLTEADAAMGDPPWPVVGPSPIAAGRRWQTPIELDEAEIQGLVRAWADAARRAAEAGFELVDVHGAHGYLLHSFLSPISNQRSDRWGGSFENRMRLPLTVVDAVRAVLPKQLVLSYRISVTDGVEGGLTTEDSIAFCRELYGHGVDVVDTSSGGVQADRSTDTRIRRGWAFHAPHSRRIRAETGGQVATVGLIVDARQAEAVLQTGDADLVFLARELLNNPNWPLHARAQLEGVRFEHWHKEAAWWLAKRQPQIDALLAAGETPMSRYEQPEASAADGT